MENAIKNSFVFYESFLDAMEEMDGDTAKETLFAIARYAMAGEYPEKLSGWAKSVFVMAKPQIDANADRYEASLNGGRPQKALPSLEELEAMRAAFDNWEAVADELKINKATLFRHMKRLRQANEEVAKQSQNLSQVAKPNVNDNDNENANVNENEKDEQADKQVERGGVQSPPVELQATPALLVDKQDFSENSVFFPTEKAISENSTSQETTGKQKQRPLLPHLSRKSPLTVNNAITA